MRISYKKLVPILLITLILCVGTFAVVAHADGPLQATAGGSGGNWISGIASFFGFPDFVSLINSLIANIMNIGLMIMSWLVALSGMFLNIAMGMTLNIKAFVDGTTAIYTTWTAIRDISSMFIIFFLLWAAIQMIIGIQDPKFNTLIKNIVVAGVLVNFSFFAAGLGIDASNIVSLQLYNAIAPANSVSGDALSFQDQGTMSKLMGDGGLSDIFMQSLNITSIYKPSLSPSGSTGNTAAASNANTPAPLKIILMGVTGMIIEFTAACSFTLAAGAFIFRFVLLLVLLAFSPIWFVAAIIPSSEIKTYAKKWTSMYTSMLLFMPVYLLLMYLALNVLTTSSFFHTGYLGNLVTSSSATWYSDYLALGVNAFIVIFLLNLPLVAAIEMGGVATGWISKNKFTSGLNMQGIWKRFGGASYTGTVGRATSKIAQSEGFKDFAARHTAIGGTLLKGTRGLASGYDAKLAGQVKSKTEFAESLGYNKRQAQFHEAELRDLRRQQGYLRSRGDINGAKALNTRIGEVEGLLNETKLGRKDTYAGSIRTRSADTIWTKVARKNKLAATKIQSENLKKRVESSNKNLEKIREEIKKANDGIEAINTRVMNTGAAGPNAAQQAKLDEFNAKLPGLITRETAAVNTVTTFEEQLSTLENVT